MSSQKNKFKDFITFYDKNYYSSEIMNSLSTGNWNPKRIDYLKQYNNNRKSFLFELEEIEAKSVSDLAPKEFFSQQKTKLIFSNFLKELSNEIGYNKKQILTIDSCSIIAERKEEYETLKRNLIKYIDYIISKNYYLIKIRAKNLNSFYLKIEKSLIKIASLKKKFSIIKNKFFLVNSQVYLKRQKLNNCKNIYNNLLKLREYKRKYLYITNKNNKIKDNNKSKFNKNEELIKNIEKFKYYNKSLICFWFIQNLKIKKNDYIDNSEELLSKLFLTKINIDEFNSVYDIYSSINNKKYIKNINEELLNKLIIFFKKNILNVFKGILLSYATIDYSESQNSNTILKLKQLQSLSFEEEKLFLAINQICITILSLCDNLYIYISTKEYRNTKFGQFLYINKKFFYDILNKKIRKILSLYTDLIINFQNKKNIYLILSSFSLIYSYIEKTFQISNTNINSNDNKNNKVPKDNTNKNENIITAQKYKTNNINTTQKNDLKNEINNFWVKLTNFELKQNIKVMALNLNRDNWKKIDIININEQVNKRNIKIIKYKDFLNLPFSNNNNLNKDEIKKQLINLPNLKESKDIKLSINKLLNKKINERNIIFTSSSFNLLFFIFEFVSYGLIIPNIRKKIFSDIFNLYDYYIYASIHMFNYDKINIEKLKRKNIINDNTNKKNNDISYDELITLSKDIDYFQNYMNLIPFLWHCKKEVLIKIFGDEKILFTIMPSLSPMILKNSNSNNEEKNNINIGNYLEKIICFESFWTLFKIIKRIVPIGRFNEIYSTKINKYKLILNEVKLFLYFPLISYKSFIKNKNYINNFINNNWEINSNNINKNKSNVYIQIILDNLNDINDKLNMFLSISLKAKNRFIYVALFIMINNIKKNVDKIKIINQFGINSIIEDFKFLQNKINKILNYKENGNEKNIKLDIFYNIFNNLYNFFNSIMANKNNFINIVGKNKIPLYLVNGLLNLNNVISLEDKKNIKVDIKCNCLKEMEIINKILMKYN